MTDTLHERETDAGASVAVATGANGERVWPEAVKARVVEETFEEGATVAGFARCHGLSLTDAVERLASPGTDGLPGRAID